MSNRQQTPGMTQLTAYLSRPVYDSEQRRIREIPPEVRLMLKGITPEHLQRLAMEASAITRQPVGDIYRIVIYPLYREVNGFDAEPAAEETPKPESLPPEQSAALLWYVFDRYWYHVAQKTPGAAILDDDERAIKAIRLMGWRTPEERNPPIVPRQG